MIVDNAEAFRHAVQTLDLPPEQQPFPKELMLIRPIGISLSQQTAKDNHYMQMQNTIDINLALIQHQTLADCLHQLLPVTVFDGCKETPDAVFPNNVFATADNKLIIGAMRYPIRRKEAQRDDIVRWFTHKGYNTIDLSHSPGLTAELTGSLIIDRARSIGYCGLSERCDRAGAEAMHRAFGLKLSFIFKLRDDEYHTNVIMSVLGGRALIIHPQSFDDPQAAQAITEFYAPHVAILSRTEKDAFCGNAIAVEHDHIWLSEHAQNKLSQKNRSILKNAGFKAKSVELSEIEKSGGSLRCCIMEVF